MLKQRFITGIILLPLVFILIYATNQLMFNVLTAVLIAVAAWEWLRLIWPTNDKLRHSCLVLFAAYLGFMLWVPPGQSNLMIQLYVISLWWGLWTLYVLVQSHSSTLPKFGRRFLLGSGFFILSTAWFALQLLKARQLESASHPVLYVFFVIWAMDIAAYFAGKAFGRNKLAPAISPGKTREGVLGGLFAVFMLSLTAHYFMPSLHIPFWQLSALSLVIALISVAGDLFESLLKRQAGVKDSSSLLPGHGGVLDRIDSLLAAMPLFVCGIILLERIQ